ncbi:MAG: NmrA family NAD(P)-binding protein [Acetobacterium sp.]|uniref:NmrA family NAD(P)-binding protein n=1 Tax=Acetobacterium TaxID=33951 RepID=UPI002B1FC08B|nr:NmrA family NAD(P)-binding protein [Acetobacterium wieringae]MEA4806499.1 NmrA family NAD(P)-binding protein [Acetobacterium wieringae]
MGKIIMTGVDGNFGGYSARSILKKVPKDQLIFTTPNKDVIKQYQEQGVETRYADIFNKETLLKAFAGGEVLLLISMPFVGERRRTAHKNAIDAAVEAGVKKIVYTSIVGAGEEDCDTYEVSDHKITEAYLKSLDIDWIILRDSQYAEAMVSVFEQSAAENGVMATNMGNGHMAFISRDDCAEVAACVAAGAGENNTIYDISGPEAMTITEFCKIGSEVTGKTVTYQELTDDEMYAFFDSIGVPRNTEGEWAETAKNFPFCSDGMVTFGRAIRLEQMNACSKDVEMLIGRKPLSVREIFQDLENHRIGSRTSTEN